MVLSPSLVCYVVAIILFALAALNWKPWATPVGLAFFALGHILLTVGLKAA